MLTSQLMARLMLVFFLLLLLLWQTLYSVHVTVYASARPDWQREHNVRNLSVYLCAHLCVCYQIFARDVFKMNETDFDARCWLVLVPVHLVCSVFWACGLVSWTKREFYCSTLLRFLDFTELYKIRSSVLRITVVISPRCGSVVICRWMMFCNVAGPRLRNSLPVNLRRCHSLEQFKRLLKTFLFSAWSHGALWHLLKVVPFINLLSHLWWRGGLVVGRRTCDLVVAGSRPGRNAAA